MRSLSSDLETAQQAASGTPYIELIFKKSGESDINYTGRLKRLFHVEQPYKDYATIVLNNADLGVENLTGYYVNVGYGYNTSSGDEYSPTSRLWVIQQSDESEEGRLESIIYLVGVWDILALSQDWQGETPYLYVIWNKTKTPYDILDELLGYFNVDLRVLSDQDDGIVDTFLPVFVIDALMFEGAKSIIYALMNTTKVYPRLEGYEGSTYIGRIKLIYPQEDDDVDYTYYSDIDSGHVFYQSFWKDNVIKPNHFIVYCNRDEDGSWGNMITGEYEDTDAADRFSINPSGDSMAIKSFHIAETISNQADANNRAEVLYLRNWHELEWGVVVVPHNCGQELFDYVKVFDNRGQ